MMDCPPEKPKVTSAVHTRYVPSARFWLMRNFELCSESFTSAAQVMDLYEEKKENLTFKLENRLVGTILSDLYGTELSTVRRSSCGETKKRPVCYGIRQRDLGINIKIDHFNENTLVHGWQFRETSESTVKFSKLSGVRMNKVEIPLEVVVNLEESSLRVTGYKGISIAGNQIGIEKHDINLDNIDLILQYLNTLHICTGVDVDEYLVAVIRNPENDGLCWPLYINGDEKVVSKQCKFLVLTTDRCCSSCRLTSICLNKRKAHYSDAARVSKSLLSKEELLLKLRESERKGRNATEREKYWRNQFENECIEVVNEDHEDYLEMLKKVNPDKLTDNMALLLQQQEKALRSASSKGYRWHPKIIKLCMDIYASSPKAFDTLKRHLILPSTRLVRYYKNSIPLSSGWNPAVFAWCSKEADRLGLKEEDRWSGLVFDEMTIQEDLQFIRTQGKCKIVGAVCLGQTYDDMQTIISGKHPEIEVAKKVMQFALVTDNGFRFVLAHFPVGSLPPLLLLEKFWEGVKWSLHAGFCVYWVLCDGGEPNRTFIKMLFPHSDPVKSKFVTYNIHTGGELVVMADCKHIFKKLRNNICKSNGSPTSPRFLKNNGKIIQFSYWKDCFEWDQASNSIHLHNALTDDHFDLTPSSKMRNKLAEDVLDSRMLFLMKQYRESLKDNAKHREADKLSESIQLLGHTSELIDLFRSKVPIESAADTRIDKAKQFLEYMREWKTRSIESKQFVSDQLWFDLQSMIIGLEEAVKLKTLRFCNGKIKPVIVNQDVLENIFCQVRAANSQNNHPGYYLYMSTIRTVNAVGQSILSKKGNAYSNREALPHADLPNPHPFKKIKLY